ncbi:MAG: PTS sugar transporter subunit IIA [Rhodopila sp.]
MELADLLSPDDIRLDVRVRDKTQLIREIARHFGQKIPPNLISAIEPALIAREQLGSTGLGNGFALPHARIASLEKCVGQFLRLARPIEFGAIDNKPVALVFALLMPEQEHVPHVGVLAMIARRFRDSVLVTNMRHEESSLAAYASLTAPFVSE